MSEREFDERYERGYDGGYVGLAVRTEGGEEIGRVSEVRNDETTGEATHLIVDQGEDLFESPLVAFDLESGAGFVTFFPELADAADTDEPDADTVGVEEPLEEGYAPAAPLGEPSAGDDAEHAGQLIDEPTDAVEAEAPAEWPREDWQDEEDTPPESGYPRNDTYVDPETGDAVVEPELREVEDLAAEAELIVEGTRIEVRAVREGVVELTGAAESQGDLESAIEELMGLQGVQSVDSTDVSLG